MKIKKIFTTRITLESSDLIYNSDKKSVCRDILQEKLVGRCYQSCLIESIDNIDCLSRTYTSDSLDASAYINVKFEVTGIIYQYNEIVHKCKIFMIKSDNSNLHITAENEYAVVDIEIKEDELDQLIYKKDDIIPIIVIESQYIPHKKKISVTGALFLPSYPENRFFIMKRELSTEEKERLLYLTNKVEEEEKTEYLSDDERNIRDSVNRLLYPFKRMRKFEDNNIAKSLNFQPKRFDEIYDLNYGIFCQPIELHRNSKMFYYSPIVDIPEDVSLELIEEDGFEIFCRFLRNYILYMNIVETFVEEYGTMENFDEYRYVWNFYERNKK
jgi:hypothetical protein